MQAIASTEANSDASYRKHSNERSKNLFHNCISEFVYSIMQCSEKGKRFLADYLYVFEKSALQAAGEFFLMPSMMSLSVRLALPSV